MGTNIYISVGTWNDTPLECIISVENIDRMPSCSLLSRCHTKEVSLSKSILCFIQLKEIDINVCNIHTSIVKRIFIYSSTLVHYLYAYLLHGTKAHLYPSIFI